MTMTARGVAVFCGTLLGAFGVLGLVVSRNGSGEDNYLLASWLFPITLFPAAALATALDSDIDRTLGGQMRVLWPAYVGLVLYATVAGDHWLQAASGVAHENYAGLLMIAVMAIHAAVFLIGGGLFALFPKTRPAGFQIWLAYPVLLVSWLGGSFLL